MAMNSFNKTILSLIGGILLSAPAIAAINLPTGPVYDSDGAFAPTTNTAVDLSLATDASWDSAGSGDGVYDVNKWAVVFKYSSVNIPSGVTVSFTNHASGAPVVWLVSGSVNIAGSISLNGYAGTRYTSVNAVPGAGGFRGGLGWQNGNTNAGGGYGPGGGTTTYRSGGGHVNAGSNSTATVYGNPRLLPLMGGSGGSGAASDGEMPSGGAGGGAILIVSATEVAIGGSIQAKGGDRHIHDNAGGGAGGAIRVVADTISGSGNLNVTSGAYGSIGRIRLEANTVSSGLITYPTTSLYALDDPVVLWPPAAAPSVKILSVNGAAAPADPRASLGPDPDLTTEYIETLDVVVETKNLNISSPVATVQVRMTPKVGNASYHAASYDAGTFEQATWTVSIPLTQDFVTLQVVAENPQP